LLKLYIGLCISRETNPVNPITKQLNFSAIFNVDDQYQA
jgi:hypothetical protein